MQVASSGWFPDPLGRHEKRFHSGVVWTDRVSDGGRQASDPIGNLSPPSASTRASVPGIRSRPAVAVAVVSRRAGKGFAVAALTFGVIAAVIALMIFIGVSFSRVTNPSRNPFASSAAGVIVDAQPVQNRVHVTRCYRTGGVGSPAASGTLVNTAGETRSFRVSVVFRVGKIEVPGVGTTGPVSAGAAGTWTATSSYASFAPTSCTVVAPSAAKPEN